MPFDYATYLTGMRQALALMSNSPPHNLHVTGYLTRIGEESTQRRRALSGQIFSSQVRTAWRENQGIAHQRLALTALAVESFRNETGRLPETLEELTPKYFEKIPEDPFTGMELKYRRMDKGYITYSIGSDREDNGGLEKADKKESEDKQSYDITFTVER